MKIRPLILAGFSLPLILLLKSCIESFDAGSISFENLLIVEGRLTNEYKQHEVLLSKTTKIDTISTNPEKNALVYVTDDYSNIFYYSEIEDGKYKSNNAFSLETNNTYILHIETLDGNTYNSYPQQLTKPSSIGSINVLLNENNLSGTTLDIYVNSLNINDEARHYYYEYEETYKIIAPYWSPSQIDISMYPDLTLKGKSIPFKRIGYRTEYFSGARIQTETVSLSENKVKSFKIRSIPHEDYKISYRYSILIKQYIETEQAYSYYETLNNFSDFGNLFSENQTGFIQGNIFNINNLNEKVIGFFDVNSVTSKRIFFDREDHIDTPSTAYPFECVLITPPILDPISGAPLLLNAYKSGYDFYAFTYPNSLGLPLPDSYGPYYMTPTICGDCTEAGGDIEKPEFWID